MSPLRRSISRIALAIYALAVPVVALLPGGSLGVTSPDKVLHAVAYGAFTVLVLASGLVKGFGPAAAVALGVGHGAAVEALQAFVPWRQAEWGDLAADGLGAVAAAVLWSLAARRSKERSEEEAA